MRTCLTSSSSTPPTSAGDSHQKIWSNTSTRRRCARASFPSAGPRPADGKDARAQRRLVDVFDQIFWCESPADVGGVLDDDVRHVLILRSRLATRARFHGPPPGSPG